MEICCLLGNHRNVCLYIYDGLRRGTGRDDSLSGKHDHDYRKFAHNSGKRIERQLHATESKYLPADFATNWSGVNVLQQAVLYHRGDFKEHRLNQPKTYRYF